MNRAICEIQIRSIRAALTHLRLLDLRELRLCAQEHGTPEDVALIDSVTAALKILPGDPH